jgi:DNA-binding NtrC family response regulator
LDAIAMANILVVDDEIGIRELLSEILADEGHVVLTADSAASARAMRQAEPPDLVLLDIWMPDTDGVTLLKEWAASGQLTMPVIMMSGHATIDTASEAARFGALDFLEKPIAMSRLLSSVKSGLEHGRLAHGAQTARHAVAPAPVNDAQEAADARPQAAFGAAAVAGVAVSLDQPLREARDQFERVYFEYHLARENFSMTRVADRAGLERTHLYRKLKQLGVELARGGRRPERGLAPEPHPAPSRDRRDAEPLED